MSPKSLVDHNPRLEKALAGLAADLPAARWIVVLSRNGIVEGWYPGHIDVQTERVAAMSAATFALGERVAAELSSGKLNYSLIAGAQGMHLVTGLDKEHCLAIGLAAGTPVDGVLAAVRNAAGPLGSALGR